jgi:hypothetical protein
LRRIHFVAPGARSIAAALAEAIPMSFKQVKPQPIEPDGSVRFGRCSVHPDTLSATCNGACTPTEGIDEEQTVRLSDEQLPAITSIKTRALRRPDLLARVTSFLRVQGPMMLTGVVLGFSFFTMARMPLGSTSVQAKAAPRPVVAAAAIDPTPVRAVPPPPPPAAWEPTQDTIERTPVARVAHHRRKAKHDRAACDPPYRYDAEGIKRLKMKCL